MGDVKMPKWNALLAAGSILFSTLLVVSIQGCSSSGTQYDNNSAGQEAYNLDELNTYGEWVQVDNYGRAWRPYAVADWAPFDNGHWAYAGGAWTWISYEPFGWMVYHYGNWYNDPSYGWVWIPSNDAWSPARVSWVDYDNYVGWAPLPPTGVSYGSPWEANDGRYWHVVNHKDFTEDNIRSYRISAPARSNAAKAVAITKPPEKRIIDTRVGRVTPEVVVTHETVKLPQRDVKKMTLPPGEASRVEQNASRVKKEVLVPREEFQSRHPESKPESEPKPKPDPKKK
jgi:hypothetical protein